MDFYDSQNLRQFRSDTTLPNTGSQCVNLRGRFGTRSACYVSLFITRPSRRWIAQHSVPSLARACAPTAGINSRDECSLVPPADTPARPPARRHARPPHHTVNDICARRAESGEKPCPTHGTANLSRFFSRSDTRKDRERAVIDRCT